MESLGEHLRSSRMAKGITLEEISAATRIRAGFLEALERDDYDAFPALVYARGFLLAYARHVGLDQEEVLSRFKSQVAMKAKEVRLSTMPRAEYPGRGLLVPIGLVVLAVIIGLLAHIISSPKLATTPTAVAPAPKVVSPPSPEPSTVMAPEVISPPQHTLSIKAVEESWVRVQIDDEQPREMTLFEGDEINLIAKKGFKLDIGNAGGIELTFNGQPLGPLDSSGQVVHLTLPRSP